MIDWDSARTTRRGIVRDVPALRTSAPIEVSSPHAWDDIDPSTPRAGKVGITLTSEEPP